MKLYYSSASPYARKCLIAAHELGVADQLELALVVTNPAAHSAELMRDNPLCKLPTLITAAGTAVYDSRVVCEYLNDLAGGSLFPAGEARWPVLVDQALADGLLDAALLVRYEVTLRPAERQWSTWTKAQQDKIVSALTQLERSQAAWPAGRVDIGVIAVAAALRYLDLRFPELDWRQGRPGLSAWFATFEQRPSMQATALKG